MRHFFVRSAVFALAFWASAASAQQFPDVAKNAPVERTGAKDVAVVVAIEDYAFLPDVPGATKNAADWEQFLSDGIGVDQVFTLTNQQAVREEILAFADKAAKAAGSGGTVWFVFIGHGGPAPSGDDGLLIGADGQQNTKSMAARGLPQKDLLAALETGQQGKTVVVIDACFSGRDASGDALAKGTMPVLAINAAPKVATSTVIMTAAKADEYAGDLPGGDRPAFSYLLLGAMRGWADDGDGLVTADEAVTYARRELLGISGRQQTPQVVGGGSVVLTRGATEASPDLWAAPVATVEPPDNQSIPKDVTATAPVVPASATDGIPDNPFYIHAAIGAGALDNFGSIGVMGDFGLGVKLNGFKKTSDNEWRVGLRLSVASTANDSAPQVGDQVGSITLESSDKVEDKSQSGLIVGPEVGKSWRSESGPGIWGDSVFTVSALGLYGRLKQCNGWTDNLDSSTRRAVCDTHKEGSGPGGGLSISGQFGLLYFGALFAYVVDLPIYASATAGLTFDL